MDQARTYDIIIWGASGFTGRLVAEYLYNTYGVDKDLKWAMGGRNEGKLAEVRAAVADENVPLIIADSHDEASLDAMTKQAKVICTTVGPYAKYGVPLVAACVKNKTHYCDLAGEPPFIREMIDKHHDTAKANGVKIVHSCGFDSIPSDLGVLFSQQQAKNTFGEYAKKVSMRVHDFAGELSGGTYASLSNNIEIAMQNRAILKVLMHPYGLNPSVEQIGPDTPGIQSVVYDETANTWIAPFMMEAINTRIVRRSHALADFPYGKDFSYDEAIKGGDGEEGKKKAQKIAFQAAALVARPGTPEKAIMDERMPKPGEGPDKAAREAGYYNCHLYLTLPGGKLAKGIVTGDMDPGYGSTSKMLAESAVCLAKDDLPEMAGILTPATAMGATLVDRLIANAGLTFSFEEIE
ncbi:MAG: saccharopine dehydrogenase NADP-binding domain-containing protein [Bacteroidota bacterium]